MTEFEIEKMTHVNIVIKELNEGVDELYESLADDEYELAKKAINALMNKLKILSKSIEAEWI